MRAELLLHCVPSLQATALKNVALFSPVGMCKKYWQIGSWDTLVFCIAVVITSSHTERRWFSSGGSEDCICERSKREDFFLCVISSFWEFFKTVKAWQTFWEDRYRSKNRMEVVFVQCVIVLYKKNGFIDCVKNCTLIQKNQKGGRGREDYASFTI